MMKNLKFWIYTKLIAYHLKRVGHYNEKKKALAKVMRTEIAEKKNLVSFQSFLSYNPFPLLSLLFLILMSAITYFSSEGYFWGIFLGAWMLGLFVSFWVVGLFIIKLKA